MQLALVVTVALALGALAPAASAAAFKARGGINHAYVLGAKKGQRLQLLDARGHVVAAGRADRFGSKIFRDLRPGGGYTVRRAPAPTRSDPSTGASSSRRDSTTSRCVTASSSP
jgi:hypothetical protein